MTLPSTAFSDIAAPRFLLEIRAKMAFSVPTSAKTTMRTPFKIAIIASTVLDTIAEKKEHRMSTLPVSVSYNRRSPFDEIQGKMLSFRGLEGRNE